MKGEAKALSLGLETQKEAADSARGRRLEAQKAVERADSQLEAVELSHKQTAQLIEEAIKLDEQARITQDALQNADRRRREAEQTRATAEENLASSSGRLIDLRKTASELEEFAAVTSHRKAVLTEQKYWLEQMTQYEKLQGDETRTQDEIRHVSLRIEDLESKESGVLGELSTEISEIERLEAACSSLWNGRSRRSIRTN